MAVVFCIFGCVVTPISLSFGIGQVRRKLTLTEELERKARNLGAKLIIPALPAGIVSIVFTEKMISGNNVDLSESTLISTSQLIPFIVGIIGLSSTVCTVVKDEMAKRRKPKDPEIGVVTESGQGTECSACGRGQEKHPGEQGSKQEELVDVVEEEEIKL